LQRPINMDKFHQMSIKINRLIFGSFKQGQVSVGYFI
jgi:hypothetical protein